MKGLPNHSGVEHNEVVLGIDRKNLSKGKFRMYNNIGVFIHKEDVDHQCGCAVIEAGTFVTGYHIGAYDNIHHTYQRLFHYINENGYKIVGDSLEFAIISISLSANKEDFITEIQIPIEKM